MAEKRGGSGEEVPRIQGFFDNWVLLLILGFVIPVLSYTVWGLVEILMVKPLPIN